MGNAIGIEARALWLSVRNEGGWWSVSELTHYWRPGLHEEEVQRHLENLHRMGFLEARARGPQTPRSLHQLTYAVTSNCQALPGYELSPNGAQHEHA